MVLDWKVETLLGDTDWPRSTRDQPRKDLGSVPLPGTGGRRHSRQWAAPGGLESEDLVC